MTEATTIKVTLLSREVYRFEPEEHGNVRWEVKDNALGILRRGSSETRHTTIRVFAPGTWRDVEIT